MNTFIINAYSQELGEQHRRWLTPPECSILGTKFTSGGDAAEGVISLYDMLSVKWENDAHFLMHNAGIRVLKGDEERQEMKFDFCCLDLDYAEHGSPPDDSWERLFRLAYLMDFVPNIVYSTRHGCRWLYVLEPSIHDANQFERHFQALIREVKKPMDNVQDCGFIVDANAKDWSRCFRCPAVIRDGKEDYGNFVRVMHEEPVNILALRGPKPKVRPTPSGNWPAWSVEQDWQLKHLVKQIEPGQRNQYLYASSCHVAEHYLDTEQDTVYEWLTAQAEQAGLTAREIETTINSAKRRLSK